MSQNPTKNRMLTSLKPLMAFAVLVILTACDSATSTSSDFESDTVGSGVEGLWELRSVDHQALNQGETAYLRIIARGERLASEDCSGATVAEAFDGSLYLVDRTTNACFVDFLSDESIQLSLQQAVLQGLQYEVLEDVSGKILKASDRRNTYYFSFSEK